MLALCTTVNDVGGYGVYTLDNIAVGVVVTFGVDFGGIFNFVVLCYCRGRCVFVLGLFVILLIYFIAPVSPVS